MLSSICGFQQHGMNKDFAKMLDFQENAAFMRGHVHRTGPDKIAMVCHLEHVEIPKDYEQAWQA